MTHIANDRGMNRRDVLTSAAALTFALTVAPVVSGRGAF